MNDAPDRLPQGPQPGTFVPSAEYIAKLRDQFRHSANTRIRQQAYRELMMLGFDPMGNPQ